MHLIFSTRFSNYEGILQCIKHCKTDIKIQYLSKKYLRKLLTQSKAISETDKKLISLSEESTRFEFFNKLAQVYKLATVA